MKNIMQLSFLMLMTALLAFPVQAATEPTEETVESGITITAEETVATKEAPDIKAAKVYGTVTATALMDRDDLSETDSAALEKAYRQLVLGRKSLKKAVPDLESALADLKADVKVSDLTVQELFHVDVEKDDASVTLEFEQDLEKGDFLLILRLDGSQWKIENPELVKITKDGNVRAKFEDGLGILAFLVEDAGQS